LDLDKGFSGLNVLGKSRTVQNELSFLSEKGSMNNSKDGHAGKRQTEIPALPTILLSFIHGRNVI
jgi:hypothetical protein